MAKKMNIVFITITALFKRTLRQCTRYPFGIFNRDLNQFLLEFQFLLNRLNFKLYVSLQFDVPAMIGNQFFISRALH